MLGSVACAVSNSLLTFVLSRFLQGMGGAMMTPVARLVLVRATPRNQLVDAMAWLSIPGLIGPIVGPPVGGFITTYASWHWIFLINVPIGLIGIVLVDMVPARLAPQRAAPDGLSRLLPRRHRLRRLGVRHLGADAAGPARQLRHRRAGRRHALRRSSISGTAGAPNIRCSTCGCSACRCSAPR